MSQEFLIKTCSDILKALSNGKAKQDLRKYAENIQNDDQRIQALHWLRFTQVHLSNGITDESFLYLNSCLANSNYLLLPSLTIADILVWAGLKSSSSWSSLLSSGSCPYNHIERHYRQLDANPELKDIASSLCASPIAPKSAKTTHSEMKFEEGGKFCELPGAEMGKVVVRFPPEASGFMHIGHAKAALLNAHYRDIFKGKLILRFDDTNPAKEKEDYEEAILHDLPSIGFKHDKFSHTSDHFDLLLRYCTQLLEQGKAYVDDTDPETMKEEREQRKESKCRNQSVEENLKRWKEMQAATAFGTKCCVRAKIDMSSDNGTMRDPTLYRCKPEPHVRTGTKYKVYPTYDFACPVVDSVEGVTHALRTSEYNDRNVQYYWVCDALGLRRPFVHDYSRLCLQNTVLSKRKLTWFVDEKLVTGWDDARMPTVRGILRHGMTPEGLRQFILAQGSSRSVAYMEWDKIWAFNKKVIEASSRRYMALDLRPRLIPVKVAGQEKWTKLSVPFHPKDTALGSRDLWMGPRVLVEQADADCFAEGSNVTFINWGNLMVERLQRGADGHVESVEARLNLEDTDFRKTLKICWLTDPAENKAAEVQLCPVSALIYENIMSKAVLGKDDDFKEHINWDSKRESCFLGDPLLRSLRKGDIIQLVRKGFYICDKPYEACSRSTNAESPCELIYIPDGTTKEKAASGAKQQKEAAEETKKKPKKGAAEPSADMTEEQRLKAEAKAREKEAKKVARKAGKAAAIAGKKEDAPDTAQAVSDKPEPKDEDKPAEKSKPEAKKNPPKPKKEKEAKESGDSKTKKQTKLGMAATKTGETSEWYQQIITKGELLEYYDVSGCYILRPWAYHVWSGIQALIDARIERLGVENSYFPMFVSKAALEREKEHVEDFAPEVAWVTRSGESDMAEPIAIRPTSETIMYPAFAKWVQSHRDLPIKLNQWSNVVRWEFKQPTPFLRTREFLWQEGHTAHASLADAEQEVMQILDLYADVYEHLLAVPVVKGRKTEKEKFAGADYTTTVEAFIRASGRAIQGATSHHLGQNFSRMFEVQFADPEQPQAKQFVYQNSWGMTTRTLGVMIMCHSDDKGLVMPPRVCRHQAVLVPCGITAKTSEQDRQKLLEACRDVVRQLQETECSPEAARFCPTRRNLRVHLDESDHVSPGWKFNHWELKGVPVRLEVGPKDLAARQVMAVLRHSGERVPIPFDQLKAEMPRLLDRVHSELLANAQADLRGGVRESATFDGLVKALDERALAVLPFCGEKACEELVKDRSANDSKKEPGKPVMGAKSLCMPFEGQLQGIRCGPCAAGVKCAQCGKQAKAYTLFGRSY